ncbi:MAG: hypothetical protein A3I91_02455 [Candidatus Kerfeldbacteria bacterium RIFCSPLOWO2_02_FULL_42_19]|nr:MAG: hypothetical protein A3E60_00800 [Candidatus Kerfeldbacteria bacterium RIFCSPHIGHO2_12_FULL_42_13]OGY83485.1 MAG: hypothetical protein A3I91_02455 [Candidatus Kerfeldbacteria bacterium RIFCSPLOWO2_02_FULL_42_19]OGY86989.1 MAG: hypothetical protein A3G01_01755 [Candidatus Kerfeldbacteria bacterium RIFCSPLOWO2_12_FULL_43_9]
MPAKDFPKEWPIYFKDNIIVGNLQNSVGIACLWTPKVMFARKLNAASYCVLSQLYSNDGINPILRNVLARPQIHTIVICGQDKIGSADALTKLCVSGIDEKYKIIGKLEAKVDKEIPREAVELFRRNVKIVDMRGVLDAAKIQQAVREHAAPNTPWAAPQLFPEPELSTERFPIDPHGVKIREKYVAQAWLRVLYYIMRFGAEKPTHHGTNQKELLNMMTIITDEDPENIHWADWFNFTREHFEGYKLQVMSAESIPSLEYTYGMRLRNHDGVNQIETLIAKIREEYFSRRAVAFTWNVAQDNVSQHPPCLDLVQVIVQDDTLHMTCYFRSNDMFRAWPENALALRTMHKEIADGVELPMGEMCIISHSAHVYEENYNEVKELLKNYYAKEVVFCRFDPRGNFTIHVNREKRQLEMIMMTPKGEKIVKYEAPDAFRMMQKLVADEAVSEIGHALDLGEELMEAEICLRTGLEYRQDITGRTQFLKELDQLLAARRQEERIFARSR